MRRMRNAMRKSIVISLSITLLIVQWGCAHAPPPRPFRPTLSEEVRTTLETIGVVSANVILGPQFKGGTRGRLHGAAKGALCGFTLCFAGGGGGDPLGTLVVAAVSGPIGLGVGAFMAESGSKVKKAEAALNKAVGELNVQETFRDRVLRVARDQTSHNFVLLQDQAPYSSLADKGVDTVLEIGVVRLILEEVEGINPPLALVMSATARLVKVSDETELYLYTLVYHSRKRKLTDWAADDAQPLREEVDRAYQGLAERIVDDLFLLVYIQ